MSLSINIQIDDGFGEQLNAIAQTLSEEGREGLHFAMAYGVAAQVKQHLNDYSAENPNKLGGKRTFFYRDAAMGTAAYATSAEGAVTVAKTGIKLQYYGGTVVPGRNPSSFSGKPTRFLTIPAVAEAYGRRASEVDNLVMLWGKNGPYALAEKIERRTLPKRGKLKKDESAYVSRGVLKGVRGGRVMFWLARSVTVGPHPEILPTDDEMSATAISSGWKFILSAAGKQAQEAN